MVAAGRNLTNHEIEDKDSRLPKHRRVEQAAAASPAAPPSRGVRLSLRTSPWTKYPSRPNLQRVEIAAGAAAAATAAVAAAAAAGIRRSVRVSSIAFSLDAVRTGAAHGEHTLPHTEGTPSQ
jgi:hypothetical protein